MIKPTIGRVVLVHGINKIDPAPVPALVCRVWNDRLINVGGFDENGNSFQRTSLQLVQEEDGSPMTDTYATWMPYQITVAKQQEASEAKES